MIPGSTDIIGCPSCGTAYRLGSLSSGNTMGARWWSDGKREAPMLPSSPLVTRCRGCGRSFWLSRGERLGVIAGFFPEPNRDVLLVDLGPRRDELLAVLGRVRGVPPHEARALLERVPVEVAQDIPRDTARELIQELQGLGATARVRPVLDRPERPERRLLLRAVGPRRVEVMAVLREHFQVGLAEVKGLLERLPLELPLHRAHLEGFEVFLGKYRAAGATVTVEELPPPEVEPLPGEVFPPEWRELPNVEELPEEELLAALAEGVAQGREEERELRLRAWWAGNDPYREPERPWKPFAERSLAARENLHALQELLKVDEPLEGLLKAEALRELERFDESRALLSRVPLPDELRKVAEQLRRLAEQHVPEVRVTIGS